MIRIRFHITILYVGLSSQAVQYITIKLNKASKMTKCHCVGTVQKCKMLRETAPKEVSLEVAAEDWQSGCRPTTTKVILKRRHRCVYDTTE